jgi:hypothetical protein
MKRETAEEAALSYVLQQYGAHPASGWLTDYSGFPEFKKLLQLFFSKNEEESIPNLVKAVHHLDAEQIRKQKESYNEQPLFRRILNRFTGKGWSLKKYENKL